MKNTFPFENTNNFEKNNNIRKNKIISYKKNAFQKNLGIFYRNKKVFNNKINFKKINHNKIRIEKSERADDNNINNKKCYYSNFIENKDDDILELGFKLKFLDEERKSNQNFHRNIKSELEDSENKKNDSLKTYFFKEVERLEFPEPIECNNIITNQKNKEDINSF